MAEDREDHGIPEDTPSTVTPSSALEATLEEHLGIHPGEAAAIGHAGAHEPSEHSYWPILVALSVLIVGIGFLTHYLVSAVGAVSLLVTIIGWFTEPWVS